MEPGQPQPSASSRQRALQQGFRRLLRHSTARDGVLFCQGEELFLKLQREAREAGWMLWAF